MGSMSILLFLAKAAFSLVTLSTHQSMNGLTEENRLSARQRRKMQRKNKAPRRAATPLPWEPT